jgi:hypothetical protein
VLRIGHPLPFRVLDTQERLRLNAGQVLIDENQFESLVARGAWAEKTLVDAERSARAQAARQAPKLSLFDRWEQLVWQFDKVSRAVLRREAGGPALSSCFASLQALVDRDPDVALFMSVRHEDRRFSLYPLRHSIHCANLAYVTARQLHWEQPRCELLGRAALTSRFRPAAAWRCLLVNRSRVRGHPAQRAACSR